MKGKEPLTPHMIAHDIMGKSRFIVTVDYYSSFIEVDRLEDTLAKTVIRNVKQHIVRYDIPETVNV